MRKFSQFSNDKKVMTVKDFNNTEKGFCDPYNHNGNVFAYEDTFYIEIHQHHYYLVLDRGEYMQEKTEQGLDFLESKLFQFVEEEFPLDLPAEMIEWMNNGNAEQISENKFIEQTTQWSKTFTKQELITFYINEYKNN